MNHVLVTGGAGFIGSNFVRHLMGQRPGVQVVNLDLCTYAANPDNLKGLAPDMYRLVQGSINDQDLVTDLLLQHRIDTVVHFAAETHVDRSIAGPSAFVYTNILGTFALLEAVRGFQEAHPDRDPIHFHHVSTDEVFGSLAPGEPAFNEATAYAPRSPYAASKAASDHLVRAYATTYGISITISNCSNNYGPYQFPEKLVPLVILNALEGRPIPIYGDGQQIRDWLYVEDHCEAIMKVLEGGQPSETYLIGGNNQPANLELVRKICELLDSMAPDSPHQPHSQMIQFVPDRPGHDRRYEIDDRNLRDTLGWAPKHDLEEGLRKTIRWYLDHREWLESIQRRPSYAEWIHLNYEAREEGP
jgi:dTDP-glucose 4,6-dehydratase